MSNLEHWQSLAHKRHIRLPRFDSKITTAAMESWLKKLNISVKEYYEYSGYKRLGDFIEKNPKWTLAAWCGLMLEYQESKENNND